MEYKNFSKDLIKAALYKCTHINQILSIVNENSKISDKSTALRVAGNILMKNKWEEPWQKLFNIELNLRKQIDQLETKQISNLVHFVRVCRETKGLRREYEFNSFEISTIFKAFNERSIESSEVIALFYDLKRIKAFTSDVDEFMLSKLRNEDFPLNTSQIKVIIRTTLNNTTIYNQPIIEACIKRILQIDFNLDLNNEVLELIEILFEADFKLIYYDPAEITEKIRSFLQETELTDKNYLRVLEAHRLFNRETVLLRTVIEKFLNTFTTASDPLVFGYILKICPSDLAASPLFLQKFVPACKEIISSATSLKKFHLVILEGLMLHTGEDLSEHFQAEDFELLFSDPDLCTKALTLSYLSRKSEAPCNLSRFKFSELKGQNFEALIKAYTILINSNVFKYMPELESEFKYEIKVQVRIVADSKKVLITFVSEQFNKSIKNSLTNLLTECIPYYYTYKTQEQLTLRALFVLHSDSEHWRNTTENFARLSKFKNYLDVLSKNFVSLNTLEALIYFNRISESKTPGSIVNYIFSLMHPSMWDREQLSRVNYKSY